MLTDLFRYLKENLLLKSTWVGLYLVVIVFFFRDSEVIHDLFKNIVNDQSFVNLCVAVISGLLIGHRPTKKG